MPIILLCVLLVLTEASAYHQDDYTVKPEIVEMVKYNRSYIRNATCGLVHFNRTYRAVNSSFYLLTDLNANLKEFFQMTYGMVNFTNTPPFIPHGRYKVETQIYHNSNFMMEIHLYGTVEEILKKFEKKQKETEN